MNIFKRWNSKAKNKQYIDYDFTTLAARKSEKDSTTLACINSIANSISGLSVNVYSTRTHEKVENHPINDLLHYPNLEEAHSTFFNGLVQDWFSGNIFLKLWRDSETGEITSMFRLNPADVQVYRNEHNRKQFKVSEGGTIRIYDDYKVLHIPSPYGYNGLVGESIFKLADKAFSTASSLDDYTEKSFNNNLGKRLVIDISNAKPDANPEQQKEIIDRFIHNYSGVEHSNRPIIKRQGVNFDVIDTGINDNRASELSENRKFSQLLIAGIFGIPLEYLNGNSSNLENTTSQYVTQAILPITNTLEEYFQRLFKVEERGKYFIKFNLKSLLKTSLVNQINAYTTQINNAMLTPNEVRKMEGLPEVEAGDYLFRNAALLPIRKDIENSLLASAKLKQQQLENEALGNQKNAEAKNIGSDKL